MTDSKRPELGHAYRCRRTGQIVYVRATATNFAVFSMETIIFYKDLADMFERAPQYDDKDIRDE